MPRGFGREGESCGLTADDHQSGRRRGPQSSPAGESALDVEHEPAGRDTDDARPDHGAGQPRRRTQADGRQPDGDQRSESELPQSRGCTEIRGLLIDGRCDDRHGERPDEHRTEYPGSNLDRAEPRPARDLGGEEKQERPQDEHLALHRQRPEMLKRTGLIGAGVVIDRGIGQNAVLSVEDRPDSLLPDRAPTLGRVDRSGDDENAEQRHRRGGQKTREPAQPIGPDVKALLCLDPTEERCREQQRGEEEEHIDATRHPADPDVVGHDESDGHRPQTIQIGSPPWRGDVARWSRTAGVSSRRRRHSELPRYRRTASPTAA